MDTGAHAIETKMTSRGCPAVIRRCWTPALLVVIVLQAVLIFSLLSSRPCSPAPDHTPTAPSVHQLMTSRQDSVRLEAHMIRTDVPRHPQRIFYNRVPKCGSTTLIDLILALSRRNSFTFARDPEYMRFYLDPQWLGKLTRRISEEPLPLIYERHLHYYNTETFGLPAPVFINIVRDPLSRLVSWYYFRRYQEGHRRTMTDAQRSRTFDQCVLGNYSECTSPQGWNPEEGYYKMIPFFCGQDKLCREPTQDALSMAVSNIKKHYLTVGTTSQFAEFVEVLEFLLPDYFSGAQQIYSANVDLWRNKHGTTYKLPVSAQVVKIMQEKLYREYQLYYFIKNRFARQVKMVRAAKEKLQLKGS